jgi:hypothetical protein
MQVINQWWLSLAQRINTCIRCLVPAAAWFYLNIRFCTSLTFSKRLPTTSHSEDEHLVYYAFSPRRVSIVMSTMRVFKYSQSRAWPNNSMGKHCKRPNQRRSNRILDKYKIFLDPKTIAAVWRVSSKGPSKNDYAAFELVKDLTEALGTVVGRVELEFGQIEAVDYLVILNHYNQSTRTVLENHQGKEEKNN